MANNNRAYGLRNYISYVCRRIKSVEEGLLTVSKYEYLYLVQMRQDIKKYFGNHLFYYKYLIREVKLEQGKKILGLNEIAFSRYIKKQREDLIKFITLKELENFAKYPYGEDE